jgi:GT2 family glycosyltransferase
MELSVIIPTHNRADSLLRTLQALERQTVTGDRFEVIVVDDGSDESQRAGFRELARRFGFTPVEKPQGGLASARNAGAELAQGAVLYFLDDDVEPAPDAVQRHLESHRASDAALAVVGALPYPESTRWTPFLWYLERSGHYDLYRDPSKYPEGRPPLPPLNGNSSITREAFFRVGRYDEGFRQYGGEDLELGYRLARAGVRFVYNPHAVGYHHHLKDFTQFCMDMERAGESLIRIYDRYPEIKQAKKIDVLEDPISTLPAKKKLIKVVMSATLAAPAMLSLPRAGIRLGQGIYALRYALFPLYRWVAHAHYAMGMRRGLASR